MWEYIIGLLALLRAYRGIRFFFIKRKIKGPVNVVHEARPFFRRCRNKKVALLLHGFTSSPREFHDLADYLAKKNISSYAPLLPGHGTSPERLSVVKYYQWIEFVEEQIAMLAQDYDEIYIVGNSFGGNLALLCAHTSTKIKGVATLGAPIFFHREKVNRFLLFPIAKRIKIFQDKKYKSNKARNLMTRNAWSYQSVPLISVSQLLKVIKLTKKNLPQVRVPLLVMQVEDDHLVAPESGEHIISQSSSASKKAVTVPKSYHMFLIDKYANLVHREILSFIEK